MIYQTRSEADTMRFAAALAGMLEAGDTVLLAGKGHETYQIIGQEKAHFDEREIVNEVFKNFCVGK